MGRDWCRNRKKREVILGMTVSDLFEHMFRFFTSEVKVCRLACRRREKGLFKPFWGVLQCLMCQGCDCTCSSPAQQSTSSCSKILSHAALMVGFLSKGCLKSRVICNVSPALQDLKNEISQFIIYFMFKKLIYYTFGLPLNSSVS